MPCRSCQSESIAKFDSEINIHLPGLDNLAEPAVLVFPRLVICMDCGFIEGRIDAVQRDQLRDGSHDASEAA